MLLGFRAGCIDCKLVSLIKMDFEKAVSFSLEELGSEEIKKEQQQRLRIVQVRCTRAGMTARERKAMFWEYVNNDIISFSMYKVIQRIFRLDRLG